MRYFAYGSNMSIARLRGRAPSARRLGTCALHGHQLRFHKRSHDGSGKCDAYQCADAGNVIFGALFEISETDKPALDRAEGLGSGYAQKSVELVYDHGAVTDATTYYATSMDSQLKPYCWYLRHVLVGARESSLPEDYIARIEAVGCIADPDLERDARERAIHG
ncbi:MAG: gamma-glutamylcyclotransferase [Gammaproteobacteria bacterium]|jgi:gamma-glutamylcyclotransferase|nr:gamma-glutamylcyclotransferase [Gammaproteobacteria bacterium]